MTTHRAALLALASRSVDVPIPPPHRTRPCGVYLLIRKSRVVYVGRTNDIEQRLAAHRYGVSGRPGKEFDRALWIEIPRADLAAYQGALTRALRPPLNTRVRALCGRDLEVLARLGLPPHDERAVQGELHRAARRAMRARS